MLTTQFTTKKTFYHNFYPGKAEEEASYISPLLVSSLVGNKVLVEIRDVFPPPRVDSHDPWLIKKSIQYFDILGGELVLTFRDTFEYVLRYWTLYMANLVASGNKVSVIIWDVTDENRPKRYEGPEFYVQMMPSGDFVLKCSCLIRERNLNAYDMIGLYWDAEASHFMFKLILGNLM